MKKKIIGSFAVLAIVALAAYNVYFNNEKEQLSALALANIEALASGESGPGDWRVYLSSSVDRCERGGSFCCPILDC